MSFLAIATGYALMFSSMTSELKEKQKENKERILKEWHKSKDYPRKKKKRVRKRLNLEYSFNCIDIPYLDL
jgi:hypothetical protein